MKQVAATDGILLQPVALSIWSLVNILQIMALVFVNSIALTFSQMSQDRFFSWLRIISLVLYISDLFLNFCTQGFNSGTRLVTLGQISRHYFYKADFFLDVTSIILLSIDSQSGLAATGLALVIYVLKLFQSLRNFEKYEYLYLTSNEKEHYFGLVKVFLTNFCIGHVLSIILNLMSQLSNEINWITRLGIVNSPWYTKYIWGYYWGTNIMLTVGFGDITATNSTQAVFIVFIETFSCITLAYNISHVGNLISSIKASKESRKKKLKAFHRMSQDNGLTKDLSSRIANFIDESFSISETFNFEEEDKIVSELPNHLQTEFRTEANRILFDNIGFLNNLSSRTLMNLATKVKRKITHPEEIFRKKGAPCEFIVIQKGSLGLCYKWGASSCNGEIIQSLTVEKDIPPKIFSLEFIKGRRYRYDIRSISYSTVYHLDRTEFMQILKEIQIDFQLFCVLKDRSQYLLGEGQVYPCELCPKTYHSKFDCTRLHYIPLRQQVIFSELSKPHGLQRRSYFRPYKPFFKPLNCLDQLLKDQFRYLYDRYGNDYTQKIEKTKKSHQKVEKLRQLASDYKKESKQFSDIPEQLVMDRQLRKIEQIIMRYDWPEDSVWGIEFDKATNFKAYFPAMNPNQLKEWGSAIQNRRKRD